MNTKLRFLALAAVGSMSAFAALLVACGDDDDGTTYTPPVIDSGNPVDTGTSDTGMPDLDSGVDAMPVPDASAIAAFRAQVDSTLCGATARCCFGSANFPDGGVVDGSTGAYYNAASCAAANDPLGFEKSNAGLLTADAGTVGIDNAKAVDCISKINGLACQLSGPDLAAARASCFDAIVGLVPIGSACTNQIECAKGSYCSNPDGGTGVCTALAGLNGHCGVFPFTGAASDGEAQIANAKANEVACSTRGGGDTGLHCNSYDPALVSDTNPNGYRPQSDWTCVANVAVDDTASGCNDTVWCNGGICNTALKDPNDPTSGDYTCQSPLEYFGTFGYCQSAISTPAH